MMVRINLLPGKRTAKSSESKRAVIVVAVILLILEAAALYWLYDGREQEIIAQSTQNKATKGKIEQMQRDLRLVPNLEKGLDMLLKRKEALLALTAERRGPRHPLDMIKIALNRPMQEEVKEIYVKGHQWDPGWEARGVYLLTMDEDQDEPGLMHFVGEAASIEDFAEFWKRMKSITLFDRVHLESIEEKPSKHPGFRTGKVQVFRLTAQTNFRYRTAKSEALFLELEQSDDICNSLSQKTP